MSQQQIKDFTNFLLKAGSLQVPGLNISTAFNPLPICKSGEWFGTPNCQATTTLQMSLNLMYLTPFAVPDVATYGAIAIEVTNPSSGQVLSGGSYNRVDVGIYNDDGTGNLNPGTLLLDVGTIALSGSVSGFQSVSISGGLTLPKAGLYWLAAVAQNDWVSGIGPTVRAIQSTMIPLATAQQNQSGIAPMSILAVGYAQSAVSGGLPSTPSNNRIGTGTCPRVMLQHM